ncbi:MAG TPA: EscU/YscU/HrcU family type III secretion system export apparatus switch protein, partial [Roseiarcus sp.]|nr:EscU/YscU/HrcU family type III secretion system export apparatus switch protein [Roseiarcus sp.]
MSAEVDHEDKTQEPTEKRLHDAIERGRIAFSREAPLFAALSAALVAFVFVIPGRAASLVAGLIGVIDDPAGWRIERGPDALALAGPLLGAAAGFLWPVVALLMTAGVVASAAQGVPRIVPDRILPDFSRVSPGAGFRRMFGARGAVEFAKSLIKLGAVSVVAGI